MKDKGKVITLYPVVSGNGAKFTATNIASAVKEEYEGKKVALVDFDLKNPYLAHSLSEFDEIHGIDNLMERIDGNALTADLFIENMIPLKNNVDLLKGTKLVGKHKSFTAKHITETIAMLEEIYDYIFIVVSPDIDNAGTVYSINKSDEIILVMRNNIANSNTLNRAVGIINGYKSENIGIKAIYNLFSEHSNIDLGNLVKNQAIEVIGMTDYDDTAVDNLNLLSKSVRKGIFGGKSKNQETYEKIAKIL